MAETAPSLAARPTLARWQTVQHFAGPLVLALTGIAMLRWGWGKWPDVLIDFGRELYVAWRLAEGEVLYRDVAYLNGPLSPYLNALWFSLFPTSLRTLFVCNIALGLVLVVLLHRTFVEISDRFAAFAATLVFLLLFACVQLDTIGNYNYVAPYSHEVTHGLLLSVAGLYALHFLETSRAALWIAGLCLGLVLLTKVEVFLAAAAGMGVVLVLHLVARRAGTAEILGLLARFGVAFLLPVATAVLLLSLAMPADHALAGVLGPWLAILDTDVASLEFYRGNMGTKDLPVNLDLLALWLRRFAGVLLPAAGLALLLRRPGWWRWPLLALVVALIAVFARLRNPMVWTEAIRPLPVLLPLLAIWVAIRFWRSVARREAVRIDALRLGLIVFALVLLAKIGFNVRLLHYGFALAMPGTLILVVALVAWIPRAIDELGGFGRLFQSAALASFAVATAFMLGIVDQRFSNRVYSVALGADRLETGLRGPFVQCTLDAIERHISPEQTLAVLPEGVMLNYLSRRNSPTPYTNFMPPELAIFGEEPMLTAFRAAPPDFVALVHKSTREYGFAFFGQDYGQALYDWIASRYRPVARFEHPPGSAPLQQGTGFAIWLMQRSDGARIPEVEGNGLRCLQAQWKRTGG
jgi:hypothetical protein